VKFLSCPDAVGKAIEHAAKRNGNLVIIKDQKIKEIEYEKCPECSAPIINEGGCKVCKCCGWNKCG
jgi:ribonucleoside-diphosphate reductase alpha chain